jgi:CheY-like chemotaxis protein
MAEFVFQPTGLRSRPRVLIVEDHQDLRDLFADYFREKGWHVEDVTNGEEAVVVAASLLPAAIIMDLAMPITSLATPILSGIRATQALKRDPRTAHIPVVVLSAYLSGASEALAAGAAEFILKPCEPKTLLENVERIVLANAERRRA